MRKNLILEVQVVEHIVLFKWNESATPEQIDCALDGLRTLKLNVPGIVDLTCGENFTDRSLGFTHALVVRFKDKEGLELYVPHFYHQKIVDTLISPIKEEILALDFEF